MPDASLAGLRTGGIALLIHGRDVLQLDGNVVRGYSIFSLFRSGNTIRCTAVGIVSGSGLQAVPRASLRVERQGQHGDLRVGFAGCLDGLRSARCNRQERGKNFRQQRRRPPVFGRAFDFSRSNAVPLQCSCTRGLRRGVSFATVGGLRRSRCKTAPIGARI